MTNTILFNFQSIKDADDFVDLHSDSITGTMATMKALSQLMSKAFLHGVREVLDINSPHYFDHPASVQFAKDMHRMGVEDFVSKAMGASRHLWRKRFKLQEVASKHLTCPSVQTVTIKSGCSSVKILDLEYYDRTVYSVNAGGLKLLLDQKPSLVNWFVDAVSRNKGYNLSTSKLNDSKEYYEMIDISIDDAIKILDNDYVVPHISAKTTYWKESGRLQSSNGSTEISYSNCKMADDWDHYSSALEISFSSIQSEYDSCSHLYGDTIYLWAGNQPCIN